MRVILTFTLFCFLPLTLFAEIKIERLMNGTIYNGNSFSVAEGGYITQKIVLERPGTISLGTRFNGSNLSIMICDEANFRRFQSRRSWKCYQVRNHPSPITLEGMAWTAGNYYVVWDNTMTRQREQTLQIWLDVPGFMGSESYSFIKRHMDYFDKLIVYTFQTGPVMLSVEPCGQKNAYASLTTGAIVMCTELFEHALKYDSLGVIYQIFFHELGHILLGQLDLPGANNESLVDEFSIYMMLQTNTASLVSDALEFWMTRDSQTEALDRLNRNIKHPISIQRARNMVDVLRDAENVSRKWNKLIYPNLTAQALFDARDKPTVVDNPALANRILISRDWD